jgi:hypothetical protein
MSTTFEVFPHHRHLPTFGALIEHVMPRLQECFHRHGLPACPQLRFDVRDKDDRGLGYTEDSLLHWPERHYAWFFFDGIAGGTDAYSFRTDHLTRERWEHEIAERQRSQQMATHIAECLDVGHWWYFRRSAGQPAVINLAYGYLAASLADLTDGVIFSDDSAWDYERFPCRAADFFTFYFEPDMAIGPNYREWSQRCLKSIPEELGS